MDQILIVWHTVTPIHAPDTVFDFVRRPESSERSERCLRFIGPDSIETDDEMTPIELAESDDDGRRDRSDTEFTRVSQGTRGSEELYGKPQHEVGFQPAEQKEAFYGEAQHESCDECRWGEPFPWLLDADDAKRRSPTRSRTNIPLRRLGREKTRTRR